MRCLNYRRRFLTMLVAAIPFACQRHLSIVENQLAPDYEGRVLGPSFESGAPGFGELTLLRIIGSSPSAPPLGFARIDGSTRFVLAKASGVDSTQTGLPGLQRSYVRVWYRGVPTSRTTNEIWGNAAIVRVDSSASKRPAEVLH